MKKIAALIAFSFYCLLSGAAAYAVIKPEPSHMSRAKNPAECSGCHAGIGARRTAMLKGERDTVCLNCHGASGKTRAQDIDSVLVKPSRHPVQETSIYHVAGESLPEKFSSMPRHVSCLDCHKSHMSDPEKAWRGSKGYVPAKLRIKARGVPPMGIGLPEADEEYELCYLCHSDSANLPADSRNVGEEFDPTNISFHPVETPGKNKLVPSLVRDLNVNSRITCGSCHGNDEASGARGPHASIYPPILVAEYRTHDGPEGPKAYELCYMCHDRRSINENESFKWHGRHVSFKDIACFSCHTAHGSRDNEHLIDFSPERVGDRVSAVNGIGPTYLRGLAGAPKCFLRCHSVDHDFTGVTSGGTKMTWEQLQAQ